MKRVRPLLRASVLGVPLLAGGCTGDVIPGPGATDTSCVLLCALQRELTGSPAAAPPVASPLPAKPVRKGAPARPHAAINTKSRTAVGAPRRMARRRPVAQVTVVPQAPARVLPSPPAAIVPPAPPPAALMPPPAAEPTRSLSQSIPGSAGIMLPGWQGW